MCHNVATRRVLLIRGDDFRTSFKSLGGLRALIDVPFMALTASAPPSIRSEIFSSLYLSNPAVVSQALDRKNIFISASPIKGLNVCNYGLV